MVRVMGNSIRAALVAGLAVGLAVSLTGCETMGPMGEQSTAPENRQENRMGTTISTPTNAPDNALAFVPVEPSYIPSTDELVGMDESDAQAILGTPALRRTETNGQVWQYRTDACVLFLFFYADEAAVARVSYLTSSGARAGQQTPGDQPCVDAVTRAAANASAVTG